MRPLEVGQTTGRSRAVAQRNPHRDQLIAALVEIAAVDVGPGCYGAGAVEMADDSAGEPPDRSAEHSRGERLEIRAGGEGRELATPHKAVGRMPNNPVGRQLRGPASGEDAVRRC